jgi:beta-phosphoglucomutase
MNAGSFSNPELKLRRIKAILFDCDGTIVDSEYAHFLAWKYALQQQNGDLVLKQYYDHVGKSAETNARLFAGQLQKDCAEQILRDKLTYYHALQQKGIPPIRATVAFLHRLAEEKERLGLKLGVASAVAKEEIMVHLHHLSIANFFDLILSGCEDLHEYNDPEGVNKPKPYIYLQAAKMLGLQPSECAVIEDSRMGVEAGASAGCVTIAVPNAYSRTQDLSRAHFRIESFADISPQQFFQLIDG